MTEQEYDDIIAPRLLEIAEKVKELGGNIVAQVEWEPGESGLTVQGDMKAAGIGQFCTYLAARYNGNIDGMLLTLIREKDVSASMFLHNYNKGEAA